MRRALLFILLPIVLGACNPVKADDIEFKHDGSIENVDKLEEFIENVEKGKVDHIRIVRRTIEGDPIFDTLRYNEKMITYIHDDSHDEFGGSEKEKEPVTCLGLDSKKSEIGKKYFLTTCSSTVGNYFEFEIPD